MLYQHETYYYLHSYVHTSLPYSPPQVHVRKAGICLHLVNRFSL